MPSFPIMLTTLLCATLLATGAVSAGEKTVNAPDTSASKPPITVPQPPPPPLLLRPGVRPAGQNVDIPVFEKVGPGLFRLGDLTISKTSSSVSLPAVVNMDKGLLEYLLVRKGDKTHESLFRTDVDPMALQTALLLIGLEGTDRPLLQQGAQETPEGNPVVITVSYLRDKKMHHPRPEEWLVKKSNGETTQISELSWVFTGSIIRNQKFLAREEGSIIALYHDPVAQIDNASSGGESDKIWFVNEKTVPPVGTPVTITIQVK